MPVDAKQILLDFLSAQGAAGANIPECEAGTPLLRNTISPALSRMLAAGLIRYAQSADGETLRRAPAGRTPSAVYVIANQSAHTAPKPVDTKAAPVLSSSGGVHDPLDIAQGGKTMAVQVTPISKLISVDADPTVKMLGQLVWWDIGSLRTNYDAFNAAWEGANLPEYKFTKTTRQEATRKGIEDWLAARFAKYGLGKKASSGTVGDEVRSLIRVINRSGSDWVAFVLVTERANMERMGLSHVSALRVGMRKKDGLIVVTHEKDGPMDDTTDDPDIRAEIDEARQPYFDTILGADLSNGMRAILRRMGGVCVRRDGGLYFMPNTEKATITRMAQVVGAAGGSISTIDLIDTKAHKAEMLKNITTGLKAEIAQAKAEIAAIKDGSRANTIQGRMDDLGRLRSKIDAYTTMLTLQSEGLMSDLDELRALVAAKLTAKEDSL